MAKLVTLQATYRIVTPMFIGGANQTPDDGIRPPSVKGALRFWWRALNWGRMRAAANCDEVALALLHQEESTLFGNAVDEDKSRPSGQARFLLQVSEETRNGIPNNANDGHKYMLGQGLMKPNGQYQRQALSSGEFTVRLRLHQSTDEQKRRQVLQALLAWGLLGGLGSRSRRGVGSVAIESVIGAESPPPIPQSIDQYGESLKWLGLPTSCALPPYSAFSEHSRMDNSVSGTDAWALLNGVGLEMMRYRGWGFDPGGGIHRVAGEPAEQNFPGDHDEMLRAVQGTSPSLLPCRAVFGLPHNYFFKSEFKKLKAKKEAELTAGSNPLPAAEARNRAKGWASARSKAELAPETTHQMRRASPILIHAHSFPDGKAAIIQTLLPAAFLPANERVRVEAKRLPGGHALVPARAGWDVIHTYLDRFAERRVLLTGRAVP